jgi:hypothetical protein
MGSRITEVPSGQGFRRTPLRIEADAVLAGRKDLRAFLGDATRLAAKAGRQLAKDYLLFPALADPSALPCLLGNLTANTTRNIWSHTISFCGHFPGEVQTFTEEQTVGGQATADADHPRCDTSERPNPRGTTMVAAAVVAH